MDWELYIDFPSDERTMFIILLWLTPEGSYICKKNVHVVCWWQLSHPGTKRLWRISEKSCTEMSSVLWGTGPIEMEVCMTKAGNEEASGRKKEIERRNAWAIIHYNLCIGIWILVVVEKKQNKRLLRYTHTQTKQSFFFFLFLFLSCKQSKCKCFNPVCCLSPLPPPKSSDFLNPS